MSRKKKLRMEYRYYEVPEKCPVLALLGEKWVQNYGYKLVAKTHRLACGMKATYFLLGFYIE